MRPRVVMRKPVRVLATLTASSLAIDLGDHQPVARRIFHREVELVAVDRDLLVAQLHRMLGPANGDLPLGGRIEPVAELAVDPPRAVGLGAAP